MQIEHPAAKMMVEIARTQEDEIGDGTTTAVMIAGKLLENAEKLLGSKNSSDSYYKRIQNGCRKITRNT